MNKINAILIDDELSARENLTYLMTNFCSEIHIQDICSHVDQAVLAIKKQQPDVVFLDIEMPQKNGFQLLKEFEEINFQIVFITAYDQYAIKAFEVSALDYLLKPIDIDRLVEVVQKVKEQQLLKSFQPRLQVFSENTKKVTKISVPYKSDYAILDIDQIVCIKADRMYSHIFYAKGKQYTASKKLSYYEELLSENTMFLRVHRSWIINTALIESYSKSDKELLLKSNVNIPVSKTYKDSLEYKLGM